MHALFDCKAVVDVWLNSFCYWMLHEFRGENAAEFLLFMYVKMNKEDFEVFTMVLWFVWRERNSVVQQDAS